VDDLTLLPQNGSDQQYRVAPQGIRTLSLLGSSSLPSARSKRRLAWVWLDLQNGY